MHMSYQEAGGESDLPKQEEKWFIAACVIINPLSASSLLAQ